MTPEEIRVLNIEGIEQRIAAIRTEMNSDTADIDALTSEVDALEARRPGTAPRCGHRGICR